MSFAPDILDAMEKTPREFNGLHVHFEAVRTVDRGLVVAQLLVQSAFRPLVEGGVVVFSIGSHELGRGPLPNPRALEVLRVSYPMKLPAEVSSVSALIVAPALAANAERVRPAWKLHDTFEIPKLSEMEPYREHEFRFSPAGTVLSTLLSGSISLEFDTRTVELAANTRTEVHKARELPLRLEREISGHAKPLHAIHVETVWVEGQPIPQPPVPKPQAGAVIPAGAIKRCGACAYEGPAAELERRTTCPACDALWG